MNNHETLLPGGTAKLGPAEDKYSSARTDLADGAGVILKSEIEALLKLDIRTLVLPQRLLALYKARTARSNRKMMASWCAAVASLNILFGIMDAFVVAPALLPAFIIGRLVITLSFWICSAAIRDERFVGGEHILIIIPCITTLVIAGIAGIISQCNDLLFGYLTNGIVAIYTGIMFLRLSLREANVLCGLCLTVMMICLLGAGGGEFARKFQLFAFYGGTMLAVVYTRRVQNFYQYRMFLMKIRDEISSSEASALNDQLSSIAYTDQLTGLPNRRYFDEICGTMSDTTKNLFPLSLCMADIDHFKNLNDNLGHLQGDRCLRLVATAIRENLRGARDILARYGGEEFVIVLPGASAEMAREIVERVRAEVEALAHPNPGSPFGIVTASFGVVAIDAPPLSIQALILEADNALYRAKTSGRNQVAA